MSRHFRTIVPILTDEDHYLFAGPGIDLLIAHSEPEAQFIASELNSDKQVYGVVRFNAAEGTCRDVTPDFIPDEEEPEYCGFDVRLSAADRAYQLRKEAI